jgi:heme-degrading monooxygenase HmoA
MTMLLERSELMIREGAEDGFWAIMRERGLAMLAGVPGVLKVAMGQGVENPQKFLLTVEWESMDAHTAFTKMPVFNEFRALFGPYSVGGAMEHFMMD